MSLLEEYEDVDEKRRMGYRCIVRATRNMVADYFDINEGKKKLYIPKGTEGEVFSSIVWNTYALEEMGEIAPSPFTMDIIWPPGIKIEYDWSGDVDYIEIKEYIPSKNPK